MRHKKDDPVNIPALSKKYKCDVKKVIKAWKHEKNDYETSQSLGIDMLKIMQLRQDIAFIHEKERQQKLKKI